MNPESYQISSDNIAEIGAIYPFAGSEVFLVIAAVAFWLFCYVVICRRESQALEKLAREYREQASTEDEPGL